ncbi:MAG: flagellar hook-basal body protein [Eubacterium sp.]|nr:flagellar hook-basal body protein [Eubacterium sp.]
MNISFYTAGSGMIAQQEGLNIYSNNIANVNTIGFKAERPSFADCIYTLQRATEPEWETGHGQYTMKTDIVWQEGGFVQTDQPLDFALPNSNFFMVMDRTGNTFLTRDGSFGMSNNDAEGTWQLVNGSGEFVLDYEGNIIDIPFMTEEQEDGTVLTSSEVDYAALEDMVGVFSVPNKWGLEQANNNHLVATVRSGPVQAEPDADKVRMALEMSTVDLASEMVHIIETQRSYQLSAKLVQTSDELINIANNLRN